jgi:hypothetical protein
MIPDKTPARQDDAAPPAEPAPTPHVGEEPKRQTLFERLKERLKDLEKQDPNNYTLY